MVNMQTAKSLKHQLTAMYRNKKRVDGHGFRQNRAELSHLILYS
jgi:hypothetical protein